MLNAKLWRHFDFWLFGAVTILVIIGVTMIRSAVAGNIELTTTTNLVNRQMIFAVAGFVVMLITASIDYRMWSSISQTLYVGTFIVLGALNIAGQALYGSARWFDTGVILIQPSEIAKIVMILVMANYFAVHLHHDGDRLDSKHALVQFGPGLLRDAIGPPHALP